MQNKGFVKVFALLLALVCIFYLSFSVVTSHFESKAETIAQTEGEEAATILTQCSTTRCTVTYGH